MYRKTYEKPCINVYEVETAAILAESGGTKTNPVSKPQSFSLENDKVTSGDADDVWE